MIELAEPQPQESPRCDDLCQPVEVALEPTRWWEWAWTAQYAAEGRTQVDERVPPEATWSRPLLAPKMGSVG